MREMVTQSKPERGLITAIVAFIAVLPATIAAVAALIVSLGTSVKVDEVHKATNSMKDALVAAALLAGRAQGVEEEKSRALIRSIQSEADRAKGAQDAKEAKK